MHASFCASSFRSDEGRLSGEPHGDALHDVRLSTYPRRSATFLIVFQFRVVTFFP